MSNRCGDCAKMVALEVQDPEVVEVQLDPEDGTITVSFHIERNCEECGSQMKEADFDAEAQVFEAEAKVKAETSKDKLPQEQEKLWVSLREEHSGKGHELVAEEDGSPNIVEESGGRYKKSYYGAEVDVVVTCTCNAKLELARVNVTGKVAASEMEDMQ